MTALFVLSDEMSVDADLLAAGVAAGLSVGDDVLRVVVVDRRHVPVVVDDAEADLAPGVVRNGRVVDQQALSLRIGELWRALGLGGVPAFVGVHPPGARVTTVAVAAWPAGGWPPEVLAEVAALRGARTDEMVWNAARARVGDVDVARLVSCGREDLSRAVWAARSCGVWIAGVELSALAVERAVRPPEEPLAVLVDRTERGAVTSLLFEWGTAVAAWRDDVDPGRPGGGGAGLWVYPVDEATARALLHDPTVAAGLLAGGGTVGVGGGRPATLVGPGEGLGPRSPRPLAAFAAAMGLALAPTAVGLDPVDLQPALLNAGVARLQARLGVRAHLLGGGTTAGASPESPGEGPGDGPGEGPPLPRRQRRHRASRWWASTDPC